MMMMMIMVMSETLLELVGSRFPSMEISLRKRRDSEFAIRRKAWSIFRKWRGIMRSHFIIRARRKSCWAGLSTISSRRLSHANGTTQRLVICIICFPFYLFFSPPFLTAIRCDKRYYYTSRLFQHRA